MMDTQDDIVIEDAAPLDEPQPEELTIEIEGEEPEAEPETPLIKRMREQVREAQREAAELRKAQAPKPVEIGPKPTLESCDWDEERHESELLAWNDRKRQVEQTETQRNRKQQEEAEQFERARIAYRTKAASIGIAGMDEAEQKVTEALGPDYVGLIISNANDPAKLIAALGRHPKLLEQVEAEANPIKRIMLLATMESKVTVKRKAPAEPEAASIQRSTVPVSKQTVDKTAEALLEKAMKPGGTMTEYNRYMRSKRQS